MSCALALDTALPTPSGWTTIGSVGVGDELFSADGTPTRVLAASEVVVGRLCWEVVFSDGTVVVADADHRWMTDTAASRKSAAAAARDKRYRRQTVFPAVRTTREIAETLRLPTAAKSANHSIANTQPLQGDTTATLPVPAYGLGVWLADGIAGTGEVITSEEEVLARLAAQTIQAHPTATKHLYRLQIPSAPSLMRLLDVLGVLTDKRIPTRYLRASEHHRRELLAALLDCNGTVGTRGIIRCSVTSPALAEDINELIVSLGYRCGLSSTHVGGQPHRRTYTTQFCTSDTVFGIDRKNTTHQARRSDRAGSRSARRSITAVRSTESVPLRCIRVDNPSGLFLASRSMIPTHQ
jgi:replicative DNA helicase